MRRSSTVAERRARALVTIGQLWRRRADGAVFRLHQVHRADRRVELRREDRVTVTFAELVGGFEEVRR